jgi:hypothetical protein
LNIIKIQFGPWLNQIGPLKFNYVIGLNFYANSSNNHLIWPLNLHFSIFGHNSVHLGLEIPPKIAAWFSPIFTAFLGWLSPHCQPLFYFLIFIFFIFFYFFGKKMNFEESPKIGWWQRQPPLAAFTPPPTIYVHTWTLIFFYFQFVYK